MTDVVPRWMPGTYTPSLTGTEDFVTDGDRLLEFIDLCWSSPETREFDLDAWQRWVIRHLLERYPDDWPVEHLRGRLRFRQAVVSLARQNGKSVIGAVLGLYALLFHSPGPQVIGVASTVEQAEIIYSRVKHVIDTTKALSKRFKATGTRGITSKVPGRAGHYFVKTGREESLQGFPITVCLADELHLWKPATWAAVALGTSAQEDGIVAGVTTAGDDESELLADLYKIGKAAAAQEEGYDERFFFALWEAPAHLPVTHPDFITSANPSVAEGRRSLEEAIRLVKTMPENQARRYVGNQFVASTASWIPMSLWYGLDKDRIPEGTQVTYSIDRSDNWTAATITASAKIAGRIYTEVVASLVNPNLDGLEEVCMDLHRSTPGTKFFMEASVLKALSDRLRERGVATEYLSSSQMQQACAMAYAAISERRVVHADDPVVVAQHPKAVAHNSGEGWRITRKHSNGDVDAVISTIISIYAAETFVPQAPLLVVV